MTQNIIKICSVDGCDKPVLARGWCKTHYNRWWAYGRTHTVIDYNSPEESFAARTEWQDDCLVWTGATIDGSYGRLHVNGKRTLAHRYAWERENGPIPKGKYIDHICHNPSCVNAQHLRLANHHQNLANRSGASSNNKSSGIRGVHKNGNRWRARVIKNGKEHHLGTFDTIEEAAVVAEQARKDLFGDYAGKG